MEWKKATAFGLAMAGLATAAQAALSASATLQLASIGGTAQSPTYTYNLVLNNTGDTTVGTFWYAWVPGEDFLTSSPTSMTNPAGWTSVITHVPNTATNGYAIQWKASTAASNVSAGGTLTGFSFTTPDNLASVSGNSLYYANVPVGTTFVYSGAPFSDAGFQFVVQSVPEPIALGALPMLALLRRRRRA